MTPEEAKTKECVFKYTAITIAITAAAIVSGEATDHETIGKGVSCGADECAQWTWFDDEKTEGRCGLI